MSQLNGDYISDNITSINATILCLLFSDLSEYMGLFNQPSEFYKFIQQHTITANNLVDLTEAAKGDLQYLLQQQMAKSFSVNLIRKDTNTLQLTIDVTLDDSTHPFTFSFDYNFKDGLIL